MRTTASYTRGFHICGADSVPRSNRTSALIRTAGPTQAITDRASAENQRIRSRRAPKAILWIHHCRVRKWIDLTGHLDTVTHVYISLMTASNHADADSPIVKRISVTFKHMSFWAFIAEQPIVLGTREKYSSSQQRRNLIPRLAYRWGYAHKVIWSSEFESRAKLTPSVCVYYACYMCCLLNVEFYFIRCCGYSEVLMLSFWHLAWKSIYWTNRSS